MRITYPFTTTLLLIVNNCFCQLLNQNAESECEVAKPNIYELFGENSDGVGEEHEKFSDLSTGAQFNILAQLNISELLDVSMTYPQFSSMVSEAFSRKYQDYLIDISLNNLTECDEYQTEDMYHTWDAHKFITITDCKFAVDFLQHFYVRTLGIDQTSLSVAFFEGASNDRNDAITLLYLRKFKNGDKEEYPFQEVEELRWRVDRNVTNMQPLNELFPKLRKLSIGLSVELNNSFADVHIPNLDDVQMFFDVSDRNGVESQLEPLLRKNPQIRSLFLMFEGSGSVAPDYAKEINAILPKLENLSLFRFDSDETICFENVKSFSLLDLESHSLHKLFFPRLESMVMVYNEAKAEDMIEFFQNHRQLSKLWFRMFALSTDTAEHRLEEVLSHLPSLTDFIAEDALSVDAILRIAKSKGELQKFTFYIDKLYDFEIKRIHEQMDDEWRFRGATLEYKRNIHYLLAERKSSS